MRSIRLLIIEGVILTGSVLSCTRITRYDFITLPTISNQTIAAALQVLSVARQLPTPAARPSNMEGETTETGESLKRQKTFKIAKKFISPKVDVLGPDIPYVPKKIKINNPLPDLNSVSVKIDNEGLQIVHLPKEVHVNKGTPKFNVQSKVDNKGIDIFHGNTPDFRLPEQAKRDPTRHNFINFQVKSDPVKSVKVMSSGSDSQYPPTDSWDEGRADNIPRAAVQRLASPLPDQDTVPPASPPSSSPAPSSSTSSPGPSSPSLPPTPPPFSPHPTSPVLTVDRLSPKRSQTNLGGLEEKLSNDELASLSQDVSLPTVQARTTMESLATAAISPEPRHAAPPPAVSSSPRRSSPAVRETEHPHAVPTPPPRVPPTPLPCKIIQVSPVPHQDFYGQTDFDQEPEDFPKKEKRFNWKCFVILIILLFLFIGAGIGVGYAVGLLGGEEVECGTGTVRSGSHCLQVATTSPASPASSSSAPLCSGCDCAQDILLDPDNSTAVQTVLVSPRYPNKYKHSADCRWTVRATRGQLQLTFTKFNLQWAQNCRDNDFVFLDQVENYGRMWLCGPFLPNSFLTQTSKFSKLTVGFKSDSSVTRLGFRAVIRAIGTRAQARDKIGEVDNETSTSERLDYATATMDNITYFYHKENTKQFKGSTVNTSTTTHQIALTTTKGYFRTAEAQEIHIS